MMSGVDVPQRVTRASSPCRMRADHPIQRDSDDLALDRIAAQSGGYTCACLARTTCAS